jgi:hypothetical protein
VAAEVVVIVQDLDLGAFAPDVFRSLYLENLKRRGGIIAQRTLSA